MQDWRKLVKALDSDAPSVVDGSYEGVSREYELLRSRLGLGEKAEEMAEPGYLEFLPGTIGIYYEQAHRCWHRIAIRPSSLRNTLVAGQKGSGKDAADLTLRFVEKRDFGIPQHVVGEDTGEHLCSSLPNTEPWFFEKISYLDREGGSMVFVDKDGRLVEPSGDRIRYVVPYSESFEGGDLYNSFPELFAVATIPVNAFFEMRDAFQQMLGITGTMEQRLVHKSLRVLEGREEKDTDGDYEKHRRQHEGGETAEEPIDYGELVNPDPGLVDLKRVYEALMMDPYARGYGAQGASGLSKIERYEDLGLFGTSSDPDALTLERMMGFLNDTGTTYYYSTGWLGYDDSNVRLLYFLYVSRLIARAKLDEGHRGRLPLLVRYNVPEMHRYAPRTLSSESADLQRSTRALLVGAYKEWRKYGLLPSGNDQRIDRLSNEILSEASEILLRDIMPSRRLLQPLMEALRMREDDYGQRDDFMANVTMGVDEFIYGFVDPTDASTRHVRDGWVAPRYWRKGFIMPPPCMKAPPNFDFMKLYDEYKQRWDNYPCGVK